METVAYDVSSFDVGVSTFSVPLFIICVDWLTIIRVTSSDLPNGVHVID